MVAKATRALRSMWRCAMWPALALHVGAAAGSLAAQDQDTAALPARLSAWAAAAYPVGEKDTADNLGPFRFGWTLWNTGESAGGYLGSVAELANGALPDARYDKLAELGLTPTREEIRAKFYPALFTEPYARFDDADLERILAPLPGVNFLVAQNTIFAPRRSDAAAARDPGYPYEAFDYPSFTARIAPRARQHGLAIAQSVGFSNHYALAPGEWTHDLAFPLITKRAPIALPGIESPRDGRGPLLMATFGGEIPGAQHTLLRCPGSMLWPQVARAVAAGIRQRVRAFSDEPGLAPVAYHIVSGEVFQFGTASERPGANPPCDSVDASNYLACLSDADYSESSVLHFRRWLELRYGTGAAGLAAVARAWGLEPEPSAGAIRECAAIDPLGLYRAHAARDLAALAADWLAFQRDQYYLGVYPFQYDAAKEARPDGSMYALEVNMRGAERAALMTDGVVLRNFLRAGEGRAEELSPWKKALLHGVSYGESVNLPFFVMPRQANADPRRCWLSGAADERPAQFGPPCWDAGYAYRTLREIRALGVDSLGLAYYEGGSFSNVVDGDFDGQGRSLVAALGSEVAATRSDGLFMAPWRSPLLVHTGAAADTGHSNQPKDFYAHEGTGRSTSLALDALADAQIQFAPFSLLEGLADLWLPADREVLLAPFVPDLDRALLARYREVAAQRGWRLLVLSDAKRAAAALGGEDAPRIETRDEVRAVATGYRLAETAELWAAPSEAAADVEALMAFVLRERMPETRRPLRPVRAVRASDAAQLAGGVDLTVACDGLGYLVAVASHVAAPTDVRLIADAAPLEGATQPEVGKTVHLDGFGSALVFLPARLADEERIAAQIPAAVARACDRVAHLGELGFETRAARAVLADVQELARGAAEERANDKILAGLLRLERMLFLRLSPAGERNCLLTAVALGGEPVAGADVQVEFVLQLRRHRDGGTTDRAGHALLDCTPLSIAEAPLWDFVRRDYVVPETNLVEVQAHHPRFGTQATTGVMRVVP